MSLIEGIFAYAKTQSGITDLLGTGDDIRLYPVIAAQGAERPYAVFYTIGAPPPEHTMGSDAGNPAAQRVRFESWADKLSKAIEVADAIEAAMMDYSGGMGAATVRRVLRDSMQNEDHDPEAGTEGRYVVRQEFLFHYEE